MHEPTYYIKSEGYIWSSDHQINQLPNQSPISSWIIKGVTVSNHKSTLASIGLLAGLHPKSLVSSKRSRAYFR